MRLLPTGHDEVTYGCDGSIPGNCPCDNDNGWCGGDHSYEHLCQFDEFHDGRHICCCGRNWDEELSHCVECGAAPRPGNLRCQRCLDRHANGGADDD